MNAVQNARIGAWLKGWNDGATAQKPRHPRVHADEYRRGFELGQSAMVDAYSVAKMRILGQVLKT